MAYKTFVNGFPLNASEINNNLMNQVISTFADASARSTAITAPVEGQVTYLTGTDDYWKWDGSAWVELPGLDPTGIAQSSNYVINGAFDIAQRGTSFADVTFTYHLDRWEAGRGGFAAKLDISRVSATDLDDFRYAMRVQRRSGDTDTNNIRNAYILETADSIPLAGKDVTLSFYARKGADWSATSLGVAIVSGTGTDEGDVAVQDNFSTGGTVLVTYDPELTTSWVRYQVTTTVPTTSTQLAIRLRNVTSGTAGAADYYEITGVQLEAGSVATPFRRHAPSLQGELAACQRYYLKVQATQIGDRVSPTGYNDSGNRVQVVYSMPASLRATPTVSYGNIVVRYAGGSNEPISSIAVNYTSSSLVNLDVSTGAVLTSGAASQLRADSAAGYIDFSAEL